MPCPGARSIRNGVKQWSIPVVDLFTSTQMHKVPQYFSSELLEKKASGGNTFKEVAKWAKICCSIHEHHCLFLRRLLKWGWHLAKITPYWPDQSWFLEMMQLAAEPPRQFLPSEWLMWNITTRDVWKVVFFVPWKMVYQILGRLGGELELPAGNWELCHQNTMHVFQCNM